MVKAALVTGSSTGIGKAIALALAQAGYGVVVHYRNSEHQAREVVQHIQAEGGTAIALHADLSQPQQAQNLVIQSHEHFGNLQVLVNNVGNYVHKPLLQTSIEEWHDMLDSNLNSTFYTCRTAVPIMRQQHYGRIINIGYAGAQHVMARTGIVPYHIAKTGVILLSKNLARTEAQYGITVNVVSPGVIENSTTQPTQEIPMGRVGTLGEMVEAVMFFVQGGEYLTGQVLEVSGGWNV